MVSSTFFITFRGGKLIFLTNRIMAKSQDAKKNVKKEAQKSAKEKRAEKREKKAKKG